MATETARWIWSDASAAMPNQWRLFRRHFTCGAEATGPVTLTISAGTRYRLWVDGHWVADGPPPGISGQSVADRIDLTAHLHDAGPQTPDGQHLILVAVHHVGPPRAEPAGLWATLTGHGPTPLVTDAQWTWDPARCWSSISRADPMQHVARFQEFFDAAQWPTAFADPASPDGPRAVALDRNDAPERHGLPAVRESIVRPVAVTRQEQCQGLMQRFRPGDLTVGLSTAGAAPDRVTIEGLASLMNGTGSATLQGSIEHLNDATGWDTDGVHDPCVTLDFGRVIFGRVEIELETFSNGDTKPALEIGYAERLIDGRFNNAIEGFLAERCVIRDGAQTFRAFYPRCFRYLRLRLRHAETPVVFRDLRLQERSFAFNDTPGFQSSDEGLNQIDRMGRNTLRLACVDAIVDTPWRESARYLGDAAAVTVPCLHAAFGETRLSRHFFQQSIATYQYAPSGGILPNTLGTVTTSAAAADASPMPLLPDYSLWWVCGLWDYVRFSGDLALAREGLPVVMGILQAWDQFTGDDGLVYGLNNASNQPAQNTPSNASPPLWPLIDWAAVDRDVACSATLNALFAAALRDAAQLARHVDDPATATGAEQRRETIQSRFTPTFFDAKRGLVLDGVHLNGHPSAILSEHANAIAIDAGLLDQAERDQVIQNAFESAMPGIVPAQPFFTSVILRALQQAGRMDLALSITRTRWGAMLRRGATSCSEEWGINGTWRDGLPGTAGRYRGFMRSESHPWSTWPVHLLSHGLMGLAILEPGCTRVALAPARTDFDYQIAAATPLGILRVIHCDDALTIESPDGMTVEES